MNIIARPRDMDPQGFPELHFVRLCGSNVWPSNIYESWVGIYEQDDDFSSLCVYSGEPVLCDPYLLCLVV